MSKIGYDGGKQELKQKEYKETNQVQKDQKNNGGTKMCRKRRNKIKAGNIEEGSEAKGSET